MCRCWIWSSSSVTNDDFIYKFIEGGCKDVQVLDLEQQQRDETIVTFKKFAEQTEKTIY